MKGNKKFSDCANSFHKIKKKIMIKQITINEDICTCLAITPYQHNMHLYRAVASGGVGVGKGGSCPPPRPVEPDTTSLWMDLFSLNSAILIIVTCNGLPYSRSTYLMTSAENSISEPPNLKVFFYKARTFGTRDNAPPLEKTVPRPCL